MHHGETEQECYILAAGSVIQNKSTLAFVLGRFNPDGILDQTFSNNGSIEATLGTYAENNSFALVRYNSDGTLDQTFGTGGH